ncbi:MAG TPA: hypothetical protein VN989_11255 [Casimicrobiaceae bacterium]|nr:hypothetical protein [Casimicrobiaceae bacterium]
MTRQKRLNVLLIATFGAVAATAAAQTPTGQQNDTPRNAPTGTAPEPAVGSTAPSPAYGGTMTPSDSTMRAPGTAIDRGAPTDMSGCKAARAACDKQPLNSRDQCRVTLNGRYASLAPKCQKLSGSALDDCLKGADTGQ